MSRDGVFIKHKKDSDTSSVWCHYLVAKDKNSAQCKRCSIILKTLGGSTKGLHTHLSSKHNIKVLIEVNCPSTSQKQREIITTQPPTKRKLIDYFTTQSDTLDDILARMTTLDGFPFSIFITSSDLRKLLIAKGYSDLPTSAVSIKKRVMNYSLKIREQITAELQQLKNSGERFSLTFDEWTSTANKRYMNVNVHSSNKYWSLGLIRVHGSMTAEVCINILKNRLTLHDISLEKDIVAIVTDGPNVMLKVGKLINVEHQTCFAHGIHLAVCDVLYNKKIVQYESLGETTNDSADMNDSDDEDLKKLDCSEAGLCIISQNNLIQEVPDLTNEQNINKLIKKIRKVVIYFKRSPTKNTVLQKYVKSENGKELSLLLDCKTRWNSLLTMLERFFLLKTSIQKALIDLNIQIHLEDSDFVLISEIIDVLAPIKLTVEALCGRDANLCTADAALKFLMNELADKNSILAHKMMTSLIHRIKQRRRVELSGILNYLQNPRKSEERSEFTENLFLILSQTIIKKQLKILIERVNSHTKDKNKEEETESESTQTQSLTQRTLKGKLQEEIEKSMKTLDPEIQKESDLLTNIKKEMNLFENGGARGHHLEVAFKYLLSIPPTSIESERAFSAAAYIGNKLRSRLGDKTLDALLFLRSHFQKSN